MSATSWMLAHRPPSLERKLSSDASQRAPSRKKRRTGRVQEMASKLPAPASPPQSAETAYQTPQSAHRARFLETDTCADFSRVVPSSWRSHGPPPGSSMPAPPPPPTGKRSRKTSKRAPHSPIAVAPLPTGVSTMAPKKRRSKRRSQPPISGTGLLNLPAELLSMVMQHLETPRDLLRFIQTSRTVYQTWQAAPTVALAAILRNMIPEENMPIAIAACKAAEVSKLWWTGVPTATFVESQDRFFEEYPRGYASHISMAHDRTLQHSLCRLWYDSEYFQGVFARNAFEVAGRKLSLPPRKTRDLTRNERTNLQRAFYRYEVYRRCVPGHWEGDQHELSTDDFEDRVRKFLAPFAPWEIEELLTVHEFLIGYAQNLGTQLGDFVVHEVSTVAHDSNAWERAHQREFKPAKGHRIQSALRLGGWDVFQPRETNEQRFKYLAARGLPFLRWLDRLPWADAVAAFVRCAFYGTCYPSLFEVLLRQAQEISARPAGPVYVNPDDIWLEAARLGNIQDPSRGWTWVRRTCLQCGVNGLRKRYILRKMGYLFWDAARLNEDWNFKRLSLCACRLDLSKRTANDDCRHWFRLSTIRTRFEKIPIPRRIFRDWFFFERFAALVPSKPLEAYREYGYPEPFSEDEARIYKIEY